MSVYIYYPCLLDVQKYCSCAPGQKTDCGVLVDSKNKPITTGGKK